MQGSARAIRRGIKDAEGCEIKRRRTMLMEINSTRASWHALIEEKGREGMRGII
jgi:hypothetical protein